MSGASDPSGLDRALVEPTLEEYYDAAPCGYLTLSPDGTIVALNDTLLEWLDASRGDVLGRRFTELLTVGSRIYFETHCSPLLAATGALREIALDLRRPGGEPIPSLVGARTVEAEGAGPVVRVTVFDATLRRRYERQLLAELDTERAARERVEALQRLTLRLGSLQSAQEVESAVVGELIGGQFATAAEIRAVRAGDPANDPAFVRRRGGTFSGVIPLMTHGARRLGTLEVQLPSEPEPEQEAFLLAAAEVAERALDRIARTETAARERNRSDGLPTQQWWNAQLAKELHRAVSQRRHLTVVAIEPQSLEALQQTEGIETADARLIEIVDAWRGLGHDLYAAFGDEEYYAVLPGLTAAQADDLVARALEQCPSGRAFAAGVAQWDRLEDSHTLSERARRAVSDEDSLRRQLGLP